MYVWQRDKISYLGLHASLIWGAKHMKTDTLLVAFSSVSYMHTVKLYSANCASALAEEIMKGTLIRMGRAVA